MSPGADPTGGIAALLELARIFGIDEFRPGRSMLFVATDAHFQGLAGMRAFMEGIGQDTVGGATDSPGTPTMQGLRRGLSADLFEFQELGRKLFCCQLTGVYWSTCPRIFTTMSTGLTLTSIHSRQP